ncbi:leucine-rich repeat- and IQ domain-containing protein 1 [Pelodytes ibericus]
MEEDIELLLSRISLSGDETNEEPAEEEDEALTSDGENELAEELPDSVLLYLQVIKRRNENIEKRILEDFESTDSHLSHCPERVANCSLEYLASEFNEEPDALRRRILDELEEEDTFQTKNVDFIHDNGHKPTIIQGNVVADIPAVYYVAEDKDMFLRFDHVQVEEKCKQKLQQWEDEHRMQSDMKSNTVNPQIETVMEQETEDEKKGNWRKKFEKEVSLLNTLHEEQQKKLNEDLRKQNEAFADELKIHKDMICKMEAEIEKEVNTLNEQRAKTSKHLDELRYKSAVKIQSKFRAFYTLRKYAPILRAKKEEMERKKELLCKLKQEQKEREERIKRKLEEKKQKKEFDKAMEEMQMQERLRQDARQKEYEKKKSEERDRLEKSKLLKEEHIQNKLMSANIETMGKDLENNYTKNSSEELIKQNGGSRPSEKEKIDTEREIVQRKMVETTTESSTISKQIDVKGEAIHDRTTTSVNIDHDSTNVCNLDSEEQPICNMPDQSLPQEKQIDSLNQRPGNLLYLSIDTKYLTEKKSPMPNQVVQPPADNTTVYVNDVKQKEETEDSVLSTKKSDVHSNHIEEKRLAWMKSCKPWAKILRDSQKTKLAKKIKQRKCSAAKKLPPLNENLIFQYSPQHDLSQVTIVTLQDLLGCSLTTLAVCAKLRYLSMRRCKLIALEGISECKALQFIDVQENCISIINCEDLENLNVLLLNKNQITSIHGLEKCKNLVNLELSFNLLTRIGGLESLNNLQRLVLDHNQLISTSGLEALPMLMYLDCSHNYLTELEGIQNCGLLQIVKSQGNNLRVVPKLDNHVLLRELYLDDNSISTLKGLSLYWLPLLHILSLSQNSLAQLEPLNTFISLEELNLSNNCLSDLTSISLWLESCVRLKKLSLNKNPLVQEANWRNNLLKVLPGLRTLNDEYPDSKDGHINRDTERSSFGTFLAFCQNQIEVICKHWKKLNHYEVSCCSLEDVESYCKTFKELMKVSNDHRYSHEYGDLEDTPREDPEEKLSSNVKQPSIDSIQLNSLVITGENENKQEDFTRQITARQLVNSSADPKGRDHLTNGGKGEIQVTGNIDSTGNAKKEIYHCENMNISKCPPPGESKKHIAAVIIQSYWRGYAVRRYINYYTKLHEAASLIQSAWRHYCIRRMYLQKDSKRTSNHLDMRYRAATLIQAVWKGFFIRKKLAAAFAAIEREELEDDLEEVNLDDFTFDENALEKGWTLNSTNFPSATLHLSRKAGQPKHFNRCSVPGDETHGSWRPLIAWQGSESSETDCTFAYDKMSCDSRIDSALHPSDVDKMSINESDHPSVRDSYLKLSSDFTKIKCGAEGPVIMPSVLEKQNLSHVSNMKSQIDVSFKSEKEEKISQEWGFKEAATAHLMMKRAQNMKSKQTRNKKMLDPAVRLALFKNNENKHLPVKPPKKVQPTKVRYFQGIEEFSQLDEVPSETLARSRDLTYRWLHTQCGEFEPTNSKIGKCKRFLPELNNGVLNGGRVQLVSNVPSKETADIEVVSVNSGSALMNRTRHSASSSGRDPFTPLKTHSGPQRKERISFRDNPTQLSGGWGRGKKRGKTFK